MDTSLSKLWEMVKDHPREGKDPEQGSLVGCSPCGHKESDTTEQLNNKRVQKADLPAHIVKSDKTRVYTKSTWPHSE